MRVRGLFCTKFNFEQLLFEAFFLAIQCRNWLATSCSIFFIWREITTASKKQKNIFIKIIDEIKIDFSIIDFFHTDYRLDRFFSNDRF